MTSSSVVHDLTTATMRTVPPATVWVFTLNEWVAIAAIAYTVLQAAHLLWKWTRELRAHIADD